MQITEARQLLQQAQQCQQSQPLVAIEAAEKAKTLFAQIPEANLELKRAKELLMALYYEEGIQNRERFVALILKLSLYISSENEGLKSARFIAERAENCFQKAGENSDAGEQKNFLLL